ncbi:MAG TPA: hypothetical protein DCL77_21120 [Prolixibacteraceae bacterium]|jgi:hypothetical protein|nr:hypothetical protein [Prolixibacteraceae bacterium]
MGPSFRRTIDNIKHRGRTSRWKRLLLLFTVILVLFIGVVILFISPITKRLIEKYDTKYTGREIQMDRAYVNPFTGYISFTNFRIYENKSDSIFFSAKDLSFNITLRKLLSKTYEISSLKINQPILKVLQEKDNFNFNDLIAKFSGAEDTVKTKDTTSEAVHFNLLNVKITNGTLNYNESGTPVDYSIKNLEIESPGMHWDNDSINSRFSFSSSRSSGDVKGEMMVNLKTMDYHIASVVKKFDLEILNQYMKALSNYGTMRAMLDADVRAKGNFSSEDSVIISGRMSVNDFHFGKTPKEDYASFDTLAVVMNEVSPMTHKFYFDSLVVKRPYLKYERYDSLDNIQTMFGKEGSNIDAVKSDPTKFNLIIELADYMKQLVKNFFRSDFSIRKLAIYNANLRFEDYSLAEKFTMALNPFTVVADSMDKNKSRVHVYVKSHVEPYGEVQVTIGLNPKDTTYFDLQYNVKKLPATLFNPYLISETSFPLDRGTIELNGSWNVDHSKINSNNHLLVIDPRLTQRIHNKLTRWIPMRIVMAFVRERGNVIDYQIPIKGDLKDPKFKLHDVVMDVLKNIFVKPVTTAYRMELKTVETQIEKSLSIHWDMHKVALGSQEERFIKNMAEFLKKNSQAVITVTPQFYEEREKEYILFFEAKKRFYASRHNRPNTDKNPIKVDRDDSLKIDKMSIKEPGFVKYLRSRVKDTLMYTIQEKCAQIVPYSVIESKFKELKKAREEEFLAHFKEKGLDNRVKFSSDKSIIPYNGFSYYQIDYEGDFPESLRKAYDKMNKLNNEPPRRKLKEESS